jgi:hypothetical protein
MGLLIPEDLLPRIMAALRGTYPDTTEGKADLPAALAVLRYWLTHTLQQWEAREAEAPLAGELESTRTRYQQRAEEARAKARDDAAAIVDNPQR